MADQKTGLVVTAHPGDFVWRAGGAIALHAKRGYRVKIVCMSYGERGKASLPGKNRAPRWKSKSRPQRRGRTRRKPARRRDRDSSTAATIR